MEELPVLEGDDNMNEHQPNQGQRQGNVNAQPTVQPGVKPDLQVELPPLIAEPLQRANQACRLGR